MAGDDGFLSRWSKRKRAVAGEAKAAPVATPAPPAPVAEEPEPEFDLSTLPALEDLTGTSDMSVFLQKGVPEALKNAALRRAWSLDPFIRDHIGPVECGWDFNDPGAMIGFGDLDESLDRGAMLRQILEGARREPAPEVEAVAEALPDPGAAADSLPPAGDAAGERADTPEALGDAPAPGAAPSDDATVFIEEIPAARRRRRHGGAIPG